MKSSARRTTGSLRQRQKRRRKRRERGDLDNRLHIDTPQKSPQKDSDLRYLSFRVQCVRHSHHTGTKAVQQVAELMRPDNFRRLRKMIVSGEVQVDPDTMRKSSS